MHGRFLEPRRGLISKLLIGINTFYLAIELDFIVCSTRAFRADNGSHFLDPTTPKQALFGSPKFTTHRITNRAPINEIDLTEKYHEKKMKKNIDDDKDNMPFY